ncbi:MAG: hypothetical protein JWO20_799 [Candidatus Angelobacter sp.]|jgi:hypothetical protein|nr:hypothetical protein [Candidatus Angelobacter sp.]
MKRLLLMSTMMLLSLPAFAGEETWKNVAMVDVACSSKVKADPDAHTKACAQQCQKSGFGIVTSDGTFLKFDENGNKEALSTLKEEKKADHIRVTVTGEREGEMIKVKSVKL